MTTDKIKVLKVLAALDNIDIVPCPCNNYKDYGPCGEPGEQAVINHNIVILPCKNHLQLYLEDNWKKYDF